MDLESRLARLEEQVARLAGAVKGLEERVDRIESGLAARFQEEARKVERQVWELLRGLRLR